MGPEHISTHSTVNNLSNLFAKGKMAMAEKMYQRALDGYERLRRVGHPAPILAPGFDLAPWGRPLENSPRNEVRYCEPALDRTGFNHICLFRKFSQVISPRNEGGFGYEDRTIVETLWGENFIWTEN